MTIQLSPEHQRFVEEQVRTGRYASTEAVIAAALNRLEDASGVSTNNETGTSTEAIRKLFAQFAALGPAPELPDQAFDREQIYQDHN